MGIDGDAVSSDARSGGKLHEPIGLCGRGLDHFPHVQSQLVTHDSHFVYQRDVHHSEGVLQQLYHFCYRGR